jgi:peptidoglycan/xylan/chitin deacetylase (PgdA/CDA1 family)
MTTRTGRRGPRALSLCVLSLLLPLLAACGGGSMSTDGDTIAWTESWTPTPKPTEAVDSTPEPAQGQGGATEFPILLSDEDRDRVRPNELGRIPVLMYHAFTENEDRLDEWTVTPTTFREQLEWLYEHDFYVTPLVDLVNNEISVPPGKHPVVLTFDDSSSGQFRLMKAEDGTLTPDPITAVGVMEAFYAEHPDFGRGGLFAVVPNNCFNYDGQETTCEERLEWLSKHDYEVANHTWWHENLKYVSDDLFAMQVGKTKIWLDERVSGEANLSNVLVLPFGEWPSADWQRQWLSNGFVYEGQDIVIQAVLTVSGGLSPSPSSGEWSRRSINRINTDPDTWDFWTGQIESGQATLYTSDGNPVTVTVPNELAEDISWHWDADWASAYGMQVIRYDMPDEPEVTPSAATPVADVATPEPARQATRSRWRLTRAA